MASPNFDRIYAYHAHAPFGTQEDRYLALREAGKTLAQLIVHSTPPSREQSLALTDVQRAVQMANAAIAINEIAPVEPVATNQESV